MSINNKSVPLRRPSISIYDYPEDLNPFKDDEPKPLTSKPPKYDSTLEKDSKKKFWTFGKSRKKRSNSFSIKSTWNGIFGKKKDDVERKPNITTVSSTYQRASYGNYPEVGARLSKDQDEFNEALGTLARRRKYTLDNSASRYGSSLTVNGDPGRIYDGSPQETTTSILGEITPKPPARRFGQVSPKPTDKIPPLKYGEDSKCDEDVEKTPTPPKRGGVRSSQRISPSEMDKLKEADTEIADENENIAEGFMFKRCSYDATRRSNMSINSCMSVGSVYHSGRKKRRAPEPPVKKLQTVQSVEGDETSEKVNCEVIEPAEIAKVTENIDELIKKSLNDDEDVVVETSVIDNDKINDDKVENVEVELKKETVETVVIVKPVDIIDDDDDDEVILRNKKRCSGNFSSTESFSVKEQIEKLEREIKILENSNNNINRNRSLSFNSNDDEILERKFIRGNNTRRSLQETRRNFFQELTTPTSRVKIELKKLPRQQNDIKIVKLSEDINSCDSNENNFLKSESVKIIETTDVNPIPKPIRINSSTQLDKLNDNINNNNIENINNQNEKIEQTV